MEVGRLLNQHDTIAVVSLLHATWDAAEMHGGKAWHFLSLLQCSPHAVHLDPARKKSSLDHQHMHVHHPLLFSLPLWMHACMQPTVDSIELLAIACSFCFKPQAVDTLG